MTGELFAIFMIGLLSSVGHCIGMCGGFVTAYSLRLNRGVPAMVPAVLYRAMPHLLYNSGRILTYGFLGFLFGWTGETLGVVLGMRHYQAALQLLAGLAMIYIALDFSGWIPRNPAMRLPGYGRFRQIVGAAMRRLNRRNVFGLGFMMGFIPCGLVYAAGAKAAATGSALNGFLIMIAFGLGTMPALLAVGMSAGSLPVGLRSTVFKAATVLVLLLGVATLYRGIGNLYSLPVSQAAPVLCIPPGSDPSIAE